MTKHCTACKRELQLALFSRCSRTKSKLQSRCKECNWNSRLQHDYGITSAQYLELLNRQNGVCAICKIATSNKSQWPDKPHRLVVDHEHATGRIRGILCDKCNQAIGLLLDSSDMILKAYLYVKKWECS